MSEGTRETEPALPWRDGSGLLRGQVWCIEVELTETLERTAGIMSRWWVGRVPLLSRRGNPQLGAVIRAVGHPPRTLLELGYGLLRSHVLIVGTTGRARPYPD